MTVPVVLSARIQDIGFRIGFALVISAFRHSRTAEVDDLTELKG